MPDLKAELLDSAAVGDTVWSEWQMSGTRRDGADHLMRGVIVFGVSQGRADWARFYLELVQQDDKQSIDSAVGGPARGAAVILVAGGTGRLGSLLVAGLTGLGEPVRVLTRNPERAAPPGPLVDVVIGDVRDPASLTAAVTGVRTVVSAVHGFAGPGRVTPRTVDRDGNSHLVAAAQTVGADLVLVSVVGASADHPMELFRMKAAAESTVEEQRPGVDDRPGRPFSGAVPGTAAHRPGQDGSAAGVRRGDNPINFVPVGDVAAAVIAATLDPTQRGNTVEVTGPAEPHPERVGGRHPTRTGQHRQIASTPTHDRSCAPWR